jgi:hypothetical protein
VNLRKFGRVTPLPFSIMMKYTGKLPNGKIFDSNMAQGGKPFVFQLGMSLFFYFIYF